MSFVPEPPEADPDATVSYHGPVTEPGWLVEEVILDDFRVERLLGHGGMGVVYLVRSLFSKRPFAVKTILASRLGTERSRRLFMEELQTWIDLPEHPHLTTCHFFRTVTDRLAIFAEYVDGGSLASWIREGRLTSLDQMLDIAIQFAWGLHAVHELGLVHQDVKPGNVLLTADGLVKLTDFGLARARATAGLAEARETGLEPTLLVSCGGLTPAYCSPEQSRGQPLSRKTDIWSWAVAILHMFIGRVTWRSGAEAAEVLETYLKAGPCRGGSHAIPPDLADVLRTCLRHEPAERWTTMAEVTEVLRSIFRDRAGMEYLRQPCAIPDAGSTRSVVHDRRTREGARWVDPRKWLHRAIRADGRRSIHTDTHESLRKGSRVAQAIADLATFEEARRIFERLVTDGRGQWRTDLAELCIEKAFVHEDVGDAPGALSLYDQAIAICEQLPQDEARRVLALASLSKANLLHAQGDLPAAVTLYDHSIDLLRFLNKHDYTPDSAEQLVKAYVNEALTVSTLGNHRAAAMLYNNAIVLYQRLVHLEGRRELRGELARACMNKALAKNTLLEDDRATAAPHAHSTENYDYLVDRARSQMAELLAMSYIMFPAMDLESKDDANALCNVALSIYETLIDTEAEHEWRGELARAYLIKANAIRIAGDHPRALKLFDHAVEMIDTLIAEEGRRDLRGDLARAYLDKAGMIYGLGDQKGSKSLYDHAIKLYGSMVLREGRRELRGDLARAIILRARILVDSGQYPQARIEIRKAMAILETEIARASRFDLHRALNLGTTLLEALDAGKGPVRT
jgi:serine/threonine protein kinase